MNPLVSIGIPTYNRPEGMKRTLDFILGQTYANIEIILSDNCSTNQEVEEIARQYTIEDSRVKYFRQSENVGIVKNFQFVLSEAKGEFYMWAADDDEWHPSFIQTCLDSMGNADMAMQHNYRTLYRKLGKTVESSTTPLNENLTYYENLLIYFNGINMSIFYGLYRREKILPVLKDDVMDSLEKLILIRFLMNNKVNTFDKCLFIEGIDAIEYELKPFFKFKNKLFSYRPYLREVSKVILLSQNLSCREKYHIFSLMLNRISHSFVKYEKSYRPLQVGLVELGLRVMLFIATLPKRVQHSFKFKGNLSK